MARPIPAPTPTPTPTIAAAQPLQIEFAAAAGRENDRRTRMVEFRTQARKLNGLIVVPFEVSNALKKFI